MLVIENILPVHAIHSRILTQIPQEPMLLHQAASFRGAEEIERLKTRMDQMLINEEWRRLVTTVIPFGERPGLVCNFVSSPDFDFDGNYLQSFEDDTRDLDMIMMTILPASTGGFVLLSCLDSACGVVDRLICSLFRQQDVSSALLCMVAHYAENWALGPDWFESLSKQQQESFKDAFVATLDPFHLRPPTLAECKLTLPDLKLQSAFRI